jgi:hypothetical protein
MQLVRFPFSCEWDGVKLARLSIPSLQMYLIRPIVKLTA